MPERPVCIVGAARSGTTILGQLLARHPDVAYWEEPKYLWQYRKPTAAHDRRTSEEATPGVQNYIRARLDRYVERRDAGRLVEKTPSNCFRIPFVCRVLPDVRIVHLLRDGRDVAFSARKQWTLDGQETGDDQVNERTLIQTARAAWARIRSLEIPLVDFPYYLMRYLRTSVLGENTPHVWGPKFPGIYETIDEHELLETCAIQWRESVRAAQEGLQSVPEDQKIEIRFEKLVTNPTETLREILQFATLREHEALIEHAVDTLWADAAYRWRDRDEREVERVMEVASPLVRRLEELNRRSR